MKLGIIQDWSESGFLYAASKGLDAVEFCVNGNYDTREFFAQVETIRGYIERTGVAVGSIGRWGARRIDDSGKVIPQALQDDRNLIDAASALGCPVYNCGCNWTDGLSFAENCRIATDYFAGLLAYADGKNVKIAVYNCDWDNFVVSPETWRVVLSDLPDLGIKYDTSHCINRGGDYLVEMRDWGDRIYHFHVKGTSRIGGEHYDDPPAGLDDVRWGPVMNLLYTKGYDGMLSIEPHSSQWSGARGQWGVDFTIRFIRPFIMPNDYEENGVSPYMP
ncbi:MAG: sugar phosphate isomerase/epimerase [Clostridia bacterium]|nr:sugar phosphate isomerase/epimerase [Clostridia bacterium]